MNRLIILLILLLIVSSALAAWLLRSPRINATGKLHVSLYEGATGTWDPRMEVLPFERSPSTMMTLRWQPPEKKYNHFVVTISRADGTLVRTESGEHDRLSLDPDALDPATEYVFALQACLDRRCKEWLIAKQEYRGTTQDQATEDIAPEPET